MYSSYKGSSDFGLERLVINETEVFSALLTKKRTKTCFIQEEILRA